MTILCTTLTSISIHSDQVCCTLGVSVISAVPSLMHLKAAAKHYAAQLMGEKRGKETITYEVLANHRNIVSL